MCTHAKHNAYTHEIPLYSKHDYKQTVATLAQASDVGLAGTGNIARSSAAGNLFGFGIACQMADNADGSGMVATSSAVAVDKDMAASFERANVRDTRKSGIREPGTSSWWRW